MLTPRAGAIPWPSEEASFPSKGSGIPRKPAPRKALEAQALSWVKRSLRPELEFSDPPLQTQPAPTVPPASNQDGKLQRSESIGRGRSATGDVHSSPTMSPGRPLPASVTVPSPRASALQMATGTVQLNPLGRAGSQQTRPRAEAETRSEQVSSSSAPPQTRHQEFPREKHPRALPSVCWPEPAPPRGPVPHLWSPQSKEVLRKSPDADKRFTPT